MADVTQKVYVPFTPSLRTDEVIPARVGRIDLSADEFEEALPDITDLQQLGLGDAIAGMPDMRRPLGMSGVFEQAVSANKEKEYGRILSSLHFARQFLDQKDNGVPPELRDVATMLIDDEIDRMQLAISKMTSLLEV